MTAVSQRLLVHFSARRTKINQQIFDNFKIFSLFGLNFLQGFKMHQIIQKAHPGKNRVFSRGHVMGEFSTWKPVGMINGQDLEYSKISEKVTRNCQKAMNFDEKKKHKS